MFPVTAGQELVVEVPEGVVPLVSVCKKSPPPSPTLVAAGLGGGVIGVGQTLGGGQMLGGPVPASGDETAEEPGKLLEGPLPAVDPSRPVTTIRLMTHQGGTVKLKLNKDMVVRELYLLAEDAAATGPGSRTVLLSFDRKPLIDMQATIKDAGLCGAQVLQQKAPA